MISYNAKLVHRLLVNDFFAFPEDAASGEGSPAKVRIYLGKNFSGTSEPDTFQDISLFWGRRPAGRCVRRVRGELLTRAGVLLGCGLSRFCVALRRILNNLKATYLKDGEFARAARVMERLVQLEPDNPVQRRDLGATLVHAGKPGRAIDHLRHYLDHVPDAPDATEVRDFLKTATRDVARWN